MTEDSEQSLYSRLGGRHAIAAIVADLVDRMRTDHRLGRFWGIVAAPTRMKLAVDFLCEVSGGPRCYTGRNMRTAHAGLRIDMEDYVAFERHLQATLAKFTVPPRETGEVMAFISTLEAEVVEKQEITS